MVFLLFPGLGYGQLFTQNFNSSALLTDYVNSTTPNNGQFNAIATSGSGMVVGINANQLRFVRTGNAGSYSRTTDFSPVPTALMYQFDMTLSGNTASATTAAVWQVGSGFGTANGPESNPATHSRLGLNIEANSGEFSLRNITSGTNSAVFSGKQTVTWVINNSGNSLGYNAPNGTTQSLPNDSFDLWVGNSQVFNDVAVTTPSVDLKNIKFVFSAGAGTIDIDNIYINSLPSNLPLLATGGVTSMSGFTYNEGMGGSASQFFNLSAVNLNPSAGNVTVTPPSDYEISKDQILYTSLPLSVPYSSGSIPNTPPIPIYVRLKAGLLANSYNGQSIVISGANAPPVTVVCNGTVFKPSVVLGALTGTAMNYPVATGPSLSANATVSGTYLNGNVVITPNDVSRWEVSTDNITWGASAVYVPSGGVLAASGNRVYVRLKAGLPVGVYSGILTAASANAVSRQITVNGEVLQPLVQINQLPQNLTLSGFIYDFAQGPSAAQNFRVDGLQLADGITVKASANWEISSNASYDGGNAAPFDTVVFPKSAANGVVDKTIHVRLKEGLLPSIYTGTITLVSPDAVTRTVVVSGEVFAGKPDMKVMGGTGAIADGSTALSGLNGTLFAVQDLGSFQTKTYTITNKGGAPLILGEINLSGANSIDFSVINAPLAGTSLSQGQSVNFDIKYAPTTLGLKTATVEIENNDPDNNPYDFAIGANAKFCGASGELVIAQQGFEEVPEFTELTYTVTNAAMYGLQTGFASGKSAGTDKPATNNLYAEGLRGFKIQGGNEPNATLKPFIMEFVAVDTSIYTNVDLSFKLAAFSLGSNTNGMDSYNASGTPTSVDADKMDFVLVEISPDNGTTWYRQAKVVSDVDNFAWGFNTSTAVKGERTYAADNALIYFKSNTGTQYNHIVIHNLPPVSRLKVRISLQDNVDKEFWIIDDVKVVSSGRVPKVWNGAAWFPSAPIKSDKAIINGDYNTATSGGSLQVCQCEINAGTLTVAANTYFIVSDQLINNGNIVVENDANFVQVNEAAVNSGTGTFTVKRNSNLKRLDYTYWSSPVIGQNLKAFSPGTLNNRFYTYNEGNDFFEEINPLTNVFGNNKSGVFESAAKGYAIRANNNYPVGSPAPMQVFNGVFKGNPHNGPVSFPLQYQSMPTGGGYNLTGNPYSSNIDFYQLANHNKAVIEKTAYFWTNLNPNPAMQGSNYPSGDFYNNYAMLNGTGGNPATLGANTSIKSATPTSIIKVGQGFLVKARQAGNLIFTNSVRTADLGSVFFNKNGHQASEPVADRYWLHLTTPLQVITTALIGYVEEATDGDDADYDAGLLSVGEDALFTQLGERRLGIQGRQAPFLFSDKVGVGTRHYAEGTYTLSLGEREGVFANGQSIYLKDYESGTVTDLSKEDYSFYANKGFTEGRFEISYQPQIVLATAGTAKEDLVIYRNGNDFIIQSRFSVISELTVYDNMGRLIISHQPYQKEIRLDAGALIPGVYLIKVNRGGEVLTRKVRK